MSRIIELEWLKNNQEPHFERLLQLLQKDEFNEFEKILQKGLKNGIDINHSYPGQGNKTLLDIACSSINKAAYVKLLLKNGANVNLIGSHGAAPIHLAVLNSDKDTIKSLVDHEGINIELENNVHETAFYLAVKHKRKDLISLLHECQVKDIKLKKRKLLNSINTHSDTDDETEPFLTNISESYMHDGSLFLLLHVGDYETFASKADEYNVKLEDNNLEFTYLQYACKLGLTKFVKRLLDLNVDPNETIESNKRPPIVIAAFYGYHNIVRLLLDAGIIVYDFNSKNVLHFVMERIYYQKSGGNVDPDKSDECNYLECLKLFLNRVPHNLLNVNSKDGQGVSPLEYAVHSNERDSILLLLERGAYFGVPARLGKPIIQYMEADVLEYLLEGSMNITKCWTKSGTHSCSVNFNYNWLTCRKDYMNVEYTNETKLLLAMSEVSKLKPYLKHPSLLVFLDLKWRIIMSTLYYLNLLQHLLFISIFSIYLIGMKRRAVEHDTRTPIDNIFWILTLTFTIMKFFKEFIQLIMYSHVNKYKYVTDYRNWMEIILIIITSTILFNDINRMQYSARYLASIAIFLSYVELLGLLLNHPSMCVHLEMYKAVAGNAFVCLLSYLPLILAFTFTFYMMFDGNKIYTPGNGSYFNYTTLALYKTLLMSAGDYDLLNTLNNDEYYINRWVAIIFIFLIPIVLLNLLTAIAVGDIKKIRKDAELVSVIARVKLITHMEETISALLSFLDRLPNCCNISLKLQLSKYDFTNYFCTTGNVEVHHNTSDNYCTINEQDTVNVLKFFISPFTQESIRNAYAKEDQKSSTADNKEANIDPHHTTAEVAQEAATPQEVCKCPETLKSVLELYEKKLKTLELKLTENIKL